MLLDAEFRETTDGLLGNIEAVRHEDILDLARRILPPEYLQSQVEGNIHRSVGYFNGDRSTLEVYLELEQPLARMVKQTWGEQLVSRFGFDLMIIVFAIPIVFVAFLIGSILPGQFGFFVAIAFGGLGIGLLLLVTAAMRAIYVAALYEYASTGTVPQLFPEDVISHSWETQPSS